MTILIESPLGGSFSPRLAPEISYTREVRSSILQPVDTQTPFVILKFPDSRSGTFEFLLVDAAAALSAETILEHGEVFTYTNDDVAGSEESFDFVVTGQIVRARNMPYRSWTVRCGFREV
jgi:hypothetical protein